MGSYGRDGKWYPDYEGDDPPNGVWDVNAGVDTSPASFRGEPPLYNNPNEFPQAPAGGGGGDPDAAWKAAYLAEHGGVAPRDWQVQKELRDASQVWAAMHGNNPMVWGGEQPRGGGVPKEIFQRLSMARNSPDVGRGSYLDWAKAADDLGGAYLAMRGINYHAPSPLFSETEETAPAKMALLQGIMKYYRGGQ